MRIGIDCRKAADFGIGTYIRGLVRGLETAGGEEEYVLFVPPSLPEPLPFEHVVVDAPQYSVREHLVMRRAIARARLDLFHATHFVLPWTSCPSVTTIHDVILVHYPPARPGASLYLSTMMRRSLRKSVSVLTVSEAAKTAILAAFPCDARKIAVTPNGVDPHFFEPGPKATDLGRYLLYVGNDKPHKNVPVLVDAFRSLNDSSLRLVLAGAAFDRYRGLPGIVTAGFVTNARLAELYRGAIALVMPSREEGFGLPVAEAMACGTPVVASPIAALMEVTGGAALHVADVQLADGLRRIVEDEALRGNLSRRGRIRAAQFTWRRCAERTAAVYRSALSV